MLNKIILFLAFGVMSHHVYAQDIPINSENSHEKFVTLLSNSKDVKYQEILGRYDAYISKYPNNVIVQVYRCKFIGTAYYDEYEDYNLKYEETESCISSLFEKYPNDPEVLLYKMENTYGEDRESLLETTIAVIDDNNDWTDKQKSRLYELATYYYNSVNYSSVVHYGELAEQLNDSLDLSVMISRAHIELGNDDLAKATMRRRLDRDQDAWNLKSKADLLVEIGEHDEALKMFDRVQEKDSTLTSNSSLYQIFIEQEKYDIARDYLVKDTIYEWNRAEKIQNLFKHDLEHSEAEIALSSYRRLQRESFYDDFLGIKRFKLFLKAPFEGFSFDDLLHFMILLVFIAVLFFLPYLWVMPIYGASKLFKRQFATEEPVEKPYWNLKHFWLFSFVYLLIQFIIVLAYFYEDYVNYYFDLVNSYVDESVVELDIDLANRMLVYVGLLFVATLFFLNRKRLRYVLNTNIGFIRLIFMSIGFVIFNMIFLKILGNFVDLSEMTTTIQESSARVEIKAMLSEYGVLTSILTIALIAPFYEEVIFRGIILSATRHRIGFVWANIIQAFLFALAHMNLSLFVFYFVFGLVTGYMVKRTNGLLAGFFFHSINNLFVVLLIYMAMRLFSIG